MTVTDGPLHGSRLHKHACMACPSPEGDDGSRRFPSGITQHADGTFVLPDGSCEAPDGTVTAPGGCVMQPDPDGAVSLGNGTKLLPCGALLSRSSCKLLDGTTILLKGLRPPLEEVVADLQCSIASAWHDCGERLCPEFLDEKTRRGHEVARRLSATVVFRAGVRQRGERAAAGGFEYSSSHPSAECSRANSILSAADEPETRQDSNIAESAAAARIENGFAAPATTASGDLLADEFPTPPGSDPGADGDEAAATPLESGCADPPSVGDPLGNEMLSEPADGSDKEGAALLTQGLSGVHAAGDDAGSPPAGAHWSELSSAFMFARVSRDLSSEGSFSGWQLRPGETEFGAIEGNEQLKAMMQRTQWRMWFESAVLFALATCVFSVCLLHV